MSESERHVEKDRGAESEEEEDPATETQGNSAQQQRLNYYKRQQEKIAAEAAEKEKENEKKRKWDSTDATEAPKKKSRWDTSTPQDTAPKSEWDEAPKEDTAGPSRSNKWDTPTPGKWKDSFEAGGLTPTPSGRRRWDAPATPQTGIRTGDAPTPTPSRWGNEMATPNRWGETPNRADFDQTPSGTAWDATPVRGTPSMKWDSTGGAMPTPRRSKWDDATVTETPAVGATPVSSAMGATPTAFTGATPMGFMGATPMGFMGATPMGIGGTPLMTAESQQELRRMQEMQARNKPYTDQELNDLLPSEGYVIVPPPAGYKPAHRKPVDQTPVFMGEEPAQQQQQRIDVVDLGPDLPSLSGPDDYQLFSDLMNAKPESEMTKNELKDHTLLQLLLKVKNGLPQQCKSAMKQLTEKTHWFGSERLCTKILDVLMKVVEGSDDQQRHIFVKLFGRIMYRIGDQVRPYVQQILTISSPMLIDADYVTRAEGREIISSLSKAAGMRTMIHAISKDCENADEYVRNVSARALAVVTSVLGIEEMKTFIKVLCGAKSSWLARHTGIKTVQQVAILMGCGILPHLKSLIDCVKDGLTDVQQKVRTMTGLALAALAEAAAPYGEEAFDCVVIPLWNGVNSLKGKPLAASLKAIGYIIPLMGQRETAEHYTKKIMPKLRDEMSSPDNEMKKIVLKVIKQCVATEGVHREFIKHQIIPDFFKYFWVKRNASDRAMSIAVVDATLEIANKVGAKDVVAKIQEGLKDENEQYRKMVIEAIQRVVESLGAVDIDEDLERSLMDGLLYAFSEQNFEINAETGEAMGDLGEVMLNGFSAVLNALGSRTKIYLPQIIASVRQRLQQKDPVIRMQAADLVSKTSKTIKLCQDPNSIGEIGKLFYECLGEEKPQVLGSILGALKSFIDVLKFDSSRNLLRDLVPKLISILKNRDEKVQENCIDLVGRIADRHHEAASHTDWEKISHELLYLLRANKKDIRRAAVNTFGYIARAIGPTDVFHTLLANLKVNERTERVCTAVAIAIVAETCGPFTVIPGLVNEYRVPEANIQHGVLKAISFMFEYIGELGKNYCYAVLPLLEHSLTDRDIIHRQMSCNIVRHMALGVVGLGCEPAIQHLLNLVFPNIFETLPHTINSCLEAIDACRVCLGPMVIMQYIFQGLFHPARKVRDVYWKLYNNTYIASQDALVPVWPRVPNEGNNIYALSELDVFI